MFLKAKNEGCQYGYSKVYTGGVPQGTLLHLFFPLLINALWNTRQVNLVFAAVLIKSPLYAEPSPKPGRHHPRFLQFVSSLWEKLFCVRNRVKKVAYFIVHVSFFFTPVFKIILMLMFCSTKIQRKFFNKFKFLLLYFNFRCIC